MQRLLFLLIIGILVSCTPQTDLIPVTATRLSPSQTPTDELSGAESEPQPSPTATVTASPIPTHTPTAAPSATTNKPTNTPALTPTPPSKTDSDLFGPDISFQGISFTIDPALAENAYAQIGPGYNSESPVLSTYFYFGQENLPCTQRGIIEIHPVEPLLDYEGMGPHLPSIQAVIDDPLSDSFPTWGAAILMQTPAQLRNLPGITGIQALVAHAQDLVFVSNELLVYDFHGFTDDGLYYVHVCYPVDAPILMNETLLYTGDTIEFDPAENTGQIIQPPTIPGDWEGFAAAAITYNEQMGIALANLPPAVFSPDLTMLTDLLESLQVNPAN